MHLNISGSGYWRQRDGGKAWVMGMTPKEVDDGEAIFGVDSNGRLCAWFPTGRHDDEMETLIDLIEPWTDPVTIDGWVNVYKMGERGPYFSGIHDTHAGAKNGSEACKYDRIDCRKIRYVQGKGIVDVTEEG